MRPIYLGERSCYCKQEGFCVKQIGKSGVDTLQEGLNIIKLILRDYNRGYTYDHSCNVIPMTERRAISRLNFLLLLAKKHGMKERDYETLKGLVSLARQGLKELKRKKIRARTSL